MMAAVSLLYFFIFFLLTVAVYKYPRYYREHRNFYSVIIPFRNEKKRLPLILQSLKKQKHDDFELIMVNDHSDDQGEKLLEGHNLVLLHLHDEFGKFAALEKGAGVANADWILFTDADCEVERNWIYSYDRQIGDEAVLYAGFVEVENSSFFTLDMFMLIGTAAGLNYFNIPSSCAGGNLAVRRDVYEAFIEEKDDEKAVLTEDAKLLHEIHSRGWGNTRFVFDPDNVVKTRNYASLKSFFKQRLRWLKGGYQLDLRLFIVMSFVFMSHILFLIKPLFLAVPFLSLFMFLYVLLKRFHKSRALRFFPLYLPFFLLYSIFIGLMFLFVSGEVEWKGRKY